MIESYELKECEVTLSEFGDSRYTIAISDNKISLERYCNNVLKKEVSVLNNVGTPINNSDNIYYIIEPSKIVVVL